MSAHNSGAINYVYRGRTRRRPYSHAEGDHMNKTLTLTVSLLLTVGFTTRYAHGQTFIDFEAPNYSTGFLVEPTPDLINIPPQNAWHGGDVGQQGWTVQFGGPFYVDDYATAAVPWIPPSLGPQTYSPPAHPGGVFPGGSQFAGKGVNTDPNFGGAQGGGRHMHMAPHEGLVEVSTDILNGPEHDYPLWQGAITSRSSSGAGGNHVGIYTTTASTYVNPGAAPREGNWAFSVASYDENGLPNESGYGAVGAFWRFDEVEGFDDLPRETWWRIGYVLDMDTRQIVELKSMNLETGEFWNMENPQAGEQGMYIKAGAAGTDDLDLVGLYNVGNGQIHAFDNVYVGEPLDWSPGIASDLNSNGFVDFEDLTILLANWNKDVTAADGNLVEPLTTVVNFADLTVLLADWTGPGPAGSPEAALGHEAVPEPSTLVLALLATVGLSVCRRRGRRRAR